MAAGVRLDRWLWAARFFKTRAQATHAVAGGQVRVNGARPKPAKDVHADDVIEVRIGELRWAVVVRALAEKRGSAQAAATLYDETDESIAERSRAIADRRASRSLGVEPGGSRPTKQQRRQLDAFRRSRRDAG